MLFSKRSFGEDTSHGIHMGRVADDRRTTLPPSLRCKLFGIWTSRFLTNFQLCAFRNIPALPVALLEPLCDIVYLKLGQAQDVLTLCFFVSGQSVLFYCCISK